MIYIVLPPREGFGPAKHGAISLCVRDSAIRTHYGVTVVGSQDPAEAFPEVPVIQVVAHKRWYRSRIDEYGRQLRQLFLLRRNATIIEIQNQPALIPYLRKLDIPLVLFLHNDSMRGAQTPGQRRQLLSACSAICCVSGFIRDRFLDGLGPSEKVHVIHNGYEPAEHLLKAEKRKRILFVGRLVPEKGALELAQALDSVLPLFPEWRADIVIPHSFTRFTTNSKPGSYQSAVYEALQKLEHRVQVHTFMPHAKVQDLFSRASIAVTPANWDEPFGRTSLEALAYGCALISTRRGGLSEFVDHSCAEVIEHVTPELLAAALAKLMGDSDLRDRLQRNAVIRASEFGLAKPVAALDELRRTLLTTEALCG